MERGQSPSHNPQSVTRNLLRFSLFKLCETGFTKLHSIREL